MSESQNEEGIKKKKVDEEWKRRAQEEKQRLGRTGTGASKLEIPPGVRRDPPRSEASSASGAGGGQGQAGEADAPPGPHDLPEAGFETFASSLAAQALMSMGQMQHPETGERYLDLGQARYTIDTMVMLREKTRGNLTPQEEQRLSTLLSELQMIFVQVSNAAARRGGGGGGGR